ncbi:MAG: class I SAM-dependent methyltransferase [Methanobacterium sp.]|nr:class I SAM-dependent methyltransferase [Methanobacterium sp.]
METDPFKMDALYKGAFAPIYPLIASQITYKIGVKEGICIDVGAGPASLSIAMAKITNLKIYAMDVKEEMCKAAERNITQAELSERIITVRGDVHHMPFPDNTADLVISRGSIPFWKDLKTAFKEIFRVLKPDGAAYVGGGFGSHLLKEKLKKGLNNEKNKSMENNFKIPKIDIDKLVKAVNKAGINNYILINDDSGLWVLIKKSID